jgi:hypothetical protein
MRMNAVPFFMGAPLDPFAKIRAAPKTLGHEREARRAPLA